MKSPDLVKIADAPAVLTMRDQFAMHALAGCLAYGGPDRCDKAALSAAAYECADAMLAARKSAKESKA